MTPIPTSFPTLPQKSAWRNRHGNAGGHHVTAQRQYPSLISPRPRPITPGAALALFLCAPLAGFGATVALSTELLWSLPG